MPLFAAALFWHIRDNISHDWIWRRLERCRWCSSALDAGPEFCFLIPGHWAAPHCGTTCSSASRKSTAGRHCRTTSPEQGSFHCHNCSSGCVSAFAPALAARHSSGADQPLPNTSLKCARSPSSSRTTAAS